VCVLLVALFPVVFLWAHNLEDDVRLTDVLIVSAWTVGVSLSVFIGLRLVYRDWPRAALGTALVGALMFSFGHVARVAGVTYEETVERALLASYLLLLAVGLFLVQRSRGIARRAIPGVNMVVSVLIALNLVEVITSGRAVPLTPVVAEVPRGASHLDPRAVGPPRDVYFLIFDRYAGEQTLRDLYGFDNSRFLDSLRDRGFMVIDDAVANYPQTTHSLSSTLNMSYLDELSATLGEDAKDRTPLDASLEDFVAARLFRRMGYRYVHVGSWWSPTEHDDTADVNFAFGGAREFPSVFLSTTAFPTIARTFGIDGFPGIDETRYRGVLSQLSFLRTIATDPRPTFTFAHITLPHPPYVFAADGSFRRPPASMSIEQQYRDQLTFTNASIDSLVRDLLAGPAADDPIVVLQSDEGPHPPASDGDDQVLTVPWGSASDTELERKLSILNAYYFPGLRRTGLYPSITPVNTFRLLFDDYYDAHLPLLPDRTFIFTDADHPYRFEDVTARVRSIGSP
jgi:hypothetical protein